MLDKIKVDYYGTPTPLQQVGNVSVPEARMIVIQPWEKSLLKPIEKAILTSELGINPTNDGNCIRLVFPEMTEERRREVSKDVKKKGDNAKVALRNIRRDANEAFKKAEKAGDISEDDLTEMTEKMQKLTDKMVEKVDKAVEEGYDYTGACGPDTGRKWPLGQKAGASPHHGAQGRLCHRGENR